MQCCNWCFAITAYHIHSFTFFCCMVYTYCFAIACHKTTKMYEAVRYQDSLVVSCKAKKKQHAHAQPTRLPVCHLQLPTLKFPSAVTQSSWVLPLSYYRANTFLPCRIKKPKMNKLGATIVKNQPF